MCVFAVQDHTVLYIYCAASNMFIELLVCVISVLLVKLYLYKQNLLKGLGHLPRLNHDLPIVGAGYRFLFKNTKRTFFCCVLYAYIFLIKHVVYDNSFF